MIVVTTPTGHIGSKVLKQLMKTSEKLRVIARDPGRLSDEVRGRVEIIEGALEDPATVASAYSGADTLFFVIPPSTQYTDVNAYYLQFAKVTVEAIKKQGVKRVVYVSGTGLGFEKKAGPVSASFLAEQILETGGAATRILHCGTFMENLFHMMSPIKYKGEFGNAVPAETLYPWVATQDIANTAVPLLLDKTWTGKGSIGVLGPEDISYARVAKIMGEVLGKEIRYSYIPSETLKTSMKQFGATDAAAQGLVDICGAITKGVFNKVPRTPETSSPTTFRQWCEETFKPAIARS